MKASKDCFRAEIYICLITTSTSAVEGVLRYLDRNLTQLCTNTYRLPDMLRGVCNHMSTSDHVVITVRWACGCTMSLGLWVDDRDNIRWDHVIIAPEYIDVMFPHPGGVGDVLTMSWFANLPLLNSHVEMTDGVDRWCRGELTPGRCEGWDYPLTHKFSVLVKKPGKHTNFDSTKGSNPGDN